MRPNDILIAASPGAREVADDMTEIIAEAVVRLSPDTRCRLLAFLHLIEDHDSVFATLETKTGGAMRLSLVHPGLPSKQN